MQIRTVIAALGGLLLSGCATSAFRAPLWPCKLEQTTAGDRGSKIGGTDLSCKFDPNASDRQVDTVSSYLRATIATYDHLIRDAEAGKAITELPVIGAAVGGGTALAMGSGAKVGIVAAGIGALGTSTSAWIKPRERVGFVVQAREAATCLLKEQSELALSAEAAALATYANPSRTLGNGHYADAFPAASAMIRSAGSISLAASDQVVSRLKVRLAGLGSAPDYSAILGEFRKAQEQSATALAADKTTSSGHALVTAKKVGDPSPPSDDQVRFILDYTQRVLTCTNKMQ